MFLLARLHLPGIWLYLWFLLMCTCTAWLIWRPVLLDPRRSVLARNVSQLWSGADLAVLVLLALFCPLTTPADPEQIGRFYAALAVICGLIFYAEGRLCWGRLSLIGLGFYAAAVVMWHVPGYAPLLHGALFSTCFVWLSFQTWQRQPSLLPEVPPTASTER
jgi:hypothetical protein